MARFFILGFLALPIIEIALFIKVGQTIGLFPTLALVVMTSLFGALVLREQGMSVVGQLRQNVSAARIPGKAIADTMMIGLAGLLLILPGFFTDAIGLALLLPPVRHWIYRGLASRVTVVSATGSSQYGAPDPHHIARPDTIDLDSEDYRPK